jgi:hypothetical protein
MTFPRFLDCAFVLLVEDYQRIGLDIMSAFSRLHEKIQPSEEGVPVQSTVVDNQRSMSELQNLLQATGGMPG